MEEYIEDKQDKREDHPDEKSIAGSLSVLSGSIVPLRAEEKDLPEKDFKDRDNNNAPDAAFFNTQGAGQGEANSSLRSPNPRRDYAQSRGTYFTTSWGPGAMPFAKKEERSKRPASDAELNKGKGRHISRNVSGLTFSDLGESSSPDPDFYSSRIMTPPLPYPSSSPSPSLIESMDNTSSEASSNVSGSLLTSSKSVPLFNQTDTASSASVSSMGSRSTTSSSSSHSKSMNNVRKEFSEGRASGNERGGVLIEIDPPKYYECMEYFEPDMEVELPNPKRLSVRGGIAMLASVNSILAFTSAGTYAVLFSEFLSTSFPSLAPFFDDPVTKTGIALFAIIPAFSLSAKSFTFVVHDVIRFVKNHLMDFRFQDLLSKDAWLQIITLGRLHYNHDSQKSWMSDLASVWLYYLPALSISMIPSMYITWHAWHSQNKRMFLQFLPIEAYVSCAGISATITNAYFGKVLSDSIADSIAAKFSSSFLPQTNRNIMRVILRDLENKIIFLGGRHPRQMIKLFEAWDSLREERMTTIQKFKIRLHLLFKFWHRHSHDRKIIKSANKLFNWNVRTLLKGTFGLFGVLYTVNLLSSARHAGDADDAAAFFSHVFSSSVVIPGLVIASASLMMNLAINYRAGTGLAEQIYDFSDSFKRYGGNGRLQGVKDYCCAIPSDLVGIGVTALFCVGSLMYVEGNAFELPLIPAPPAVLAQMIAISPGAVSLISMAINSTYKTIMNYFSDWRWYGFMNNLSSHMQDVQAIAPREQRSLARNLAGKLKEKVTIFISYVDKAPTPEINDLASLYCEELPEKSLINQHGEPVSANPFGFFSQLGSQEIVEVPMDEVKGKADKSMSHESISSPEKHLTERTPLLGHD